MIFMNLLSGQLHGQGHRYKKYCEVNLQVFCWDCVGVECVIICFIHNIGVAIYVLL